MRYNQSMVIRRVEAGDFEQSYRMRVTLWPYAIEPQDEAEMQEYLTGTDKAALVAQSADGAVIGFVEVGMRPYADGCRTRNVGYIEGWYVEAAHRRQGVGAALVRAAEEWARTQGCQEMASDCFEDNEVSLAAHLALGYTEKERLIHFAKEL